MNIAAVIDIISPSHRAQGSDPDAFGHIQFLQGVTLLKDTPQEGTITIFPQGLGQKSSLTAMSLPQVLAVSFRKAPARLPYVAFTVPQIQCQVYDLLCHAPNIP
jgi:hypothetical protein